MQKHYDKVPTQGSTNPVKSDGLHQQLATIGSKLDNLESDVAQQISAVNSKVDNIKPINLTNNGTITNLADEEDITSENNLLKLKDRGNYIILRKNKSFSSQVTQQNTIYEIRYVFDLDGTSVTIPSGCTLKFNGGKVSNGIVDLNYSCELEGSGMNCNIKNPSSKPFPLSYYLSDVSNTTLNNSVVQALLDSNIPIIDDIPVLEFADCIYVNKLVIIEGQGAKRKLSFPNSRGIVWNKKQYSSENKIANLVIESYGNCIDIYNNGSDTDAPYNVFQSEFKRLNLKSLNGDCITSGIDNKGVNGDSMLFDNLFEEIYLESPNGCGIVGSNGGTNEYIKIRSGSCGEAVFKNCSGHFLGFNGTWGTTNTFFKGVPRTGDLGIHIYLELENCNIESFKNVLFDSPSNLVYMHLTIKKSSIYITPNSNGIIDYFPFDLGIVGWFHLEDNRIYYSNNGTYDSNHALLKCHGANENIVDCAIEYYNSLGYKENTILAIKKNGNGALSRDFFTTNYDTFGNIDVNGILKYGTLQRKYITKTTTGNGVLALDSPYNALMLKCSSDIEGYTENLNYCTLPSLLEDADRKIGYKLVIYNGNNYAKILFKYNYRNGIRFIAVTGEDYILEPKAFVEAELITSWDGYGICIIKPISSEIGFKAGATRPSVKLVKGQQFFDTSIGRLICFNGTGWVDSEGYPAENRKGSTDSRPTLLSEDAGFQYYDTDLGKYICWNGTAWVNMDGSALS